MTNDEIHKMFKVRADEYERDWKGVISIKTAFWDGADWMKEKKDQQFRECLEKKREAYRKEKHRASLANNTTKELICFIKSKVVAEIINEFFEED